MAMWIAQRLSWKQVKWITYSLLALIAGTGVVNVVVLFLLATSYL